MDRAIPAVWARRGPVALWAFVVEITVIVTAAAVLLDSVATRWSPVLAAYSPWDGTADLVAVVEWLLSTGSEPTFYTSALSGAGLLLGGGFAHWLMTRGSRWQGFTQACGSDAWLPMVAAALLGVLLSNLLWGWSLQSTGVWQPLFVPFVSVSPTVVLMFGPSVRTVLTGAGLGALTTPPLSIIGTTWLCPPLGLPPVVGVTGGMAAGAVVAFAICRYLPWMPQPLTLRQQESPAPAALAHRHGVGWSIRRVLADFSEAPFFGSEWASFGLILGGVAAFLLNPALPSYGSGLFLQIVVGQVLTAALGVVLWWRQWASRPFFPTFVPVVSVVPATVLTYGGTAASILAGAVLGAMIGPPIAAAISRRLPSDFHPFIGNVASMAVSTALVVPALGLVPGFST
jgi:hypothetical protein